MLYYAGVDGTIVFPIVTVALAGLAWLVALGTDALGNHVGPGLTGVLQSTLGNLPELFVVIFALKAGEVVVAQTSILGSLFANALLVLGLVIIAGARASEDSVMRFHPRLPNDTATLLLLASFLIVLLGLSVSSRGQGGEPPGWRSPAFGAVVLLIVYGTWLRSYLRATSAAEAGERGAASAAASLAAALVLLAIAGVGAAFVSDWFVAALNPAIEALHISQAFAGLVIVAIAGNAVENVAGIVLAYKGKIDDRHLGGEELGRPDRRVPLPRAGAGLAAVHVAPDLRARAGLHRRAAAHRDPVWQVTGDGEATIPEGAALVGST